MFEIYYLSILTVLIFGQIQRMNEHAKVVLGFLNFSLLICFILKYVDGQVFS